MNKTLLVHGVLLFLAGTATIASAHVELVDLDGDGDCNDPGESIPGPHVHDCITLTSAASSDGS